MSQKVDLSVEKVAKLANIPLKKAQASKLKGQLTDALEYVEILNQVETEKTLPTSQVTGLQNVSRADQQKKSFSQEEAVGNARSKQAGYFKVPGVLKNEA